MVTKQVAVTVCYSRYKSCESCSVTHLHINVSMTFSDICLPVKMAAEYVSIWVWLMCLGSIVVILNRSVTSPCKWVSENTHARKSMFWFNSYMSILNQHFYIFPPGVMQFSTSQLSSTSIFTCSVWHLTIPMQRSEVFCVCACVWIHSIAIAGLIHMQQVFCIFYAQLYTLVVGKAIEHSMMHLTEEWSRKRKSSCEMSWIR